MEIREDFQRARSGKEQAARRAEILDATEALLRESGNDRFTISALAKKVGISKSTVFLYFSNKEELLATVYVRAGEDFFTRLRNSLHRGMTDLEFCEAFANCALANPTLLILRSMFASSFAQCLSQAFLVPALQEYISIRTAASADIEDHFDLEPGQGRAVIRTFLNLMSGALQVDVQRYIDTKNLPEDQLETVRYANFRIAFLDGAELVMKGIRR